MLVVCMAVRFAVVDNQHLNTAQDMELPLSKGADSFGGADESPVAQVAGFRHIWVHSKRGG